MQGDGNHAIVSSRYDYHFNISNFDPNNSTDIPSDSIVNFKIDQDNGTLTAIQVVPAGGMVPRDFSINEEGNLLAIALQDDSRIVMIERDVESGLLGDFVGNISVAGQLVSVIFDE